MPSRPPHLAVVPLTVMLAAGLTGCFTTSADFGDDAESYLLENETLRDTLFPDTDTTFTTATCDDPADQDVDTTFMCTATDSDGGAWEFEMVITGSSAYEVNVSRFPDTT